MRGVDNHAETAVRSILHQHRSHLLQDSLRNFVLLILGIVARILHGTFQGLLLLLNLLYQRTSAVIVQFLTLGIELLLQSLNFVVLIFELGCLGSSFLLRGLEITLAFVGGKNGLLDVDRPHPVPVGVGAREQPHCSLPRSGRRATSASGPGPQPIERTPWT